MADQLTITGYSPYGDTEKPGDYSLGEAVKIMVDQSPDYHDGQVESLRAQVQMLTTIVAAMADALREQIGEEGVKAIIQYPLQVKEDPTK